MKRYPRRALAAALALLLAAPAAAEVCGPGDVGDIDMSCHGLWRERNRVFAEHGICFKSARAIREFGRGCRRPYGQLDPTSRCYVAALERLERERHCAAE